MFKTLIKSSYIQLNLISNTIRSTYKPITFITYKYFSQSSINYKTNTSTRTKENVHDLKTFLELIGRNCVEHLDSFEGDLNKFLETPSKKMKDIGIDTRTRRYLLRWKHKFINNLEPLREHPRGKKKNGGERKAKTVIAKRKALQRLEDKEKFSQQEMDAENRGERLF
ncbi:FYV4 [Candida jiufengensis]|uniref:FYV4 n=1 Tax=Candida jiufengensis TaxID=497108 RepID=UPI0022259E40|nr:FYV4 [Candida jiufengensis]KAI5955754.1 FYV4 [Candida jiufengensis]